LHLNEIKDMQNAINKK